MPLLKNKPDLVKKALAVRDLLRPHVAVFYDDAGSIGRRYARQDEAGTPFCLTIDFDTLGRSPNCWTRLPCGIAMTVGRSGFHRRSRRVGAGAGPIAMAGPPLIVTSLPARVSYAIMLAMLAMIGWLHLATLVLTALFGYFAIRALNVDGRKWAAVSLYLILVAIFFVGLVYFSKQAYVTLPKIANSSIPAAVGMPSGRGWTFRLPIMRASRGWH